MTRRSTRAAGVLLACALTASVSSCTSDDEPAATPPDGGVSEPPALVVSAPVTRVAGRLSDGDRLSLRREVETLLQRYVEAAYVDPDATPRSAFPGFTYGAVRLARIQGALLSRVGLEVDDVEVRRVTAAVSAFAPGGRAQGATARVEIVLDTTSDDEEGRARVEGRLLLTPAGGSWRVFGFDVRGGER
jgi:hypothetical protein